MERYICIHGHFYQPPRENAWLEAIELQDSAYPYHDWNERIAAECYKPNATSRILDDNDRIVQIVNNYAKISFNFGPTLLAWLEAEAPDVYRDILEADKKSQERFSGHGSALAQAYNHMILPLANRRDKKTQIIWGIRDFQQRFGRKPEGMWLPETAVDLETLDVLAAVGVRFTILAPHQAKRIRAFGAEGWHDVSNASIDPSRAYRLFLPSGRSIALFFYDGPISRAVAFENILNKGESFALRLLEGFDQKRTWPQFVHIATDGESYGHHHRSGDMGLAYALDYIESRNLARLSNYGEYLEKCPPNHEVEIFENTSWSCSHGIERWRNDCGCNSGGHPGWNQAWRAPLRQALDWLRDSLATAYSKNARKFLKDPWKARDDYIQVILDRSKESTEAFFNRHALYVLDEDDKTAVLELMEIQRHAMLMYTSCGWFFDELSGIETVQVIQYAGRAVQLAQKLFGDSIESRFLELLKKAKANIPEHKNGRHIYEKFVETAKIDLKKVCAHYAMSTLFEENIERTPIYCYTAEQEDYQSFESGKTKLVVGLTKVTSKITGESATLSFNVLHFGEHNLNCGVREYLGPEKYTAMIKDVFEVFSRADFADTIRLLDRDFGVFTYSIRSLFRDQQRKIIGLILDSILKGAETNYRQIYENHAPTMRFLKDVDIPAPKALYVATELVLNDSLQQAFESEKPELETVKPLLEEAQMEGITLDVDTLEYRLRKNLEKMAKAFHENPAEISLLQRLEEAVSLAHIVPFQVNLRQVQNLYYELLQSNYHEFLKRAEQQEEGPKVWVRLFTSLGEKLSIKV